MLRPLFSSLVTRGLIALGMFAFSVFAGRTLGAAGAGLVALAQAILLLLVTVGSLGMQVCAMRYVAPLWSRAQHDELARLHRMCFGLVGVVAGSLALLAAVFSVPIARHVFEKPELVPLILPILIAIPVFSLNLVQAGFIKGIGSPAIGNLLEKGGAELLAVVLALALIPWFSLHSAAQLVWLYSGCFLLLLLVSTRFTRFGIATRATRVIAASDLFRAGIHVASSQIFIYITYWSAPIFLGIFSGNSDIGIYNAAAQASLLVSLVLLAANSVIPPRFAACFDADDRAGIERIATRSSLVITVAALPILVIFLLAPGTVLSIFGAEFAQGAVLLQVLAVGQFVNAMTGSVGNLLFMTDNGRAMQRITGFTAALATCLYLVFIPLHGAMAAAIVTALCIVVQNLLSIWVVYRRLGIRCIPGWAWLAARNAD